MSERELADLARDIAVAHGAGVEENEGGVSE